VPLALQLDDELTYFPKGLSIPQQSGTREGNSKGAMIQGAIDSLIRVGVSIDRRQQNARTRLGETMKNRVIGSADSSSSQRGAPRSFASHLIGKIEKTSHHRGHGSLQVLVDEFTLILWQLTIEKHEALFAAPNEFGPDIVTGINQSIR
jgi:hypothetical protein